MSAYKYAIESLRMERRYLVEQLAYQKEEKEKYQKNLNKAMDQITEMALRKTEIDEAISALGKMEEGQKKTTPDPSVLKEKFKAKNTELEMLKSEREMLEKLLDKNKSDINELIVHMEILTEGIKQEGK